MLALVCIAWACDAEPPSPHTAHPALHPCPQTLSCPSFMPEGGKLGVHFRNTYQESAVSKAEKQ